MNLRVVGVTSNVGGWDKNVRCWHARVRSLVVLTKVCIAHKFNIAKFIDASLVFWIIQNTVFSQCCGSSTVLTFLIFVIRTVDHPRFIFHWVDLLHDSYTACKSSDFFLVLVFWSTPTDQQDYDYSSLSISDKDRVRNADPNEGHCLLTNALNPLNFCHCIPRKNLQEKDIVRAFRIHYYLF